MEDEDHRPQQAQKWLEDMSNGLCHEIEALTLEGIQIEHAEKGLVRCKFIIPKHLSDRDGNWHVGAIAVLIDDVGAAAICSAVGHIKVSVHLSISYHSTAKIQEEVEIEGKVIGHKEKLSLVVVAIKNKNSGNIIAFGKQWMTSVGVVETSTTLHHSSKL
ncbi:hypothetical protein ACSBR1_043438 [Camellia fascicularis]